jgi:hypothetical protein
MTSWGEFAEAEPEFAARVRTILDAHEVKVLATLRADGSPRVSGLEVDLSDGEELRFGSMPGAVKGADLRRDPRFALHSTPVPSPGVPGDVKLAGRAVSTGPLTGEVPGDWFRAEITEVVRTGLNDAGDRLVVESWRPGRGRRRVERE